MSSRSLLYYPTIALPEGDWLKQTILYWDRVSSIVPMRFDPERGEDVPVVPTSPDIDYLTAQGVFVPIRPESFFGHRAYWHQLQAFESEFRRLASGKMFLQTLPPKRGRRFTARVHLNKLNRSILWWCVESGLAKDRKGFWVDFEPQAALLYMGLLAKHLAFSQPEGFVPGTDQKAYESLLFDAVSPEMGICCGDLRLRGVLPVPIEQVSFEDIIAFRKNPKNRVALLKFQKVIDGLIKDVSSASTITDANDVVADFRRKLELGSAELSETLHDAKIETVLGSVKSLINLKSPWVLGAGLAVAGKIPGIADIPLNLALPGIATVALVEIGYHYVHEGVVKRAILRKHDFAYLHYAQQANVI